ncbi:MAG: PfkB family carbohydrate kinase [Spirochaetaceae bacterium]|jgi:1-phosphofructokinase/tagatose 6-phosphate kinase|nr:PfkB family carbohydrate kinase [Spirochaetaceae bacterium]
MNPTLQKTLRFSGLVMDAVNRTATHRLDASGKGINVSRVLTQLGKTCLHLTQLGGAFRGHFLDLCARDGLTVEWVESGSGIRFCHTLINDADHSVTELVEESEPVAPETEEQLKTAYTRLLPDFGWVIISGTKAAGFSEGLVPFMTRAAKEAGKKVILDLRGKDLENSLAYKPEVIKPNLVEFASTFAPELTDGIRLFEDWEDRIKTICLALAERYACRIVLTGGAEPVKFAEGGGFGEYAFEPVQPVNTTGSGDAFTAGLAGALAEGASLRDAIAQGIRCGALNAGLLKVGAIR